MVDLIVFNVGSNRYAMNIENIQRIIQASELTVIPNSHEYIDGMMSYEDKVIKILNFRKLIKMKTYQDELEHLFNDLKLGHKEWVDSLVVSVENGVEFTKTLNPHACELGKWIDSFTAYDDNVVLILNELMELHKELHLSGARVLELCETDKDDALNMLNSDVKSIYKNTMAALDTFVNELDLVADSLQKFVIYDNNGSIFAIKVDKIEDIAHVEESEFINSNNEDEMNDFLELEGVLDLEGVLINVIKTVQLPK